MDREQFYREIIRHRAGYSARPRRNLRADRLAGWQAAVLAHGRTGAASGSGIVPPALPQGGEQSGTDGSRLARTKNPVGKRRRSLQVQRPCRHAAQPLESGDRVKAAFQKPISDSPWSSSEDSTRMQKSGAAPQGTAPLDSTAQSLFLSLFYRHLAEILQQLAQLQRSLAGTGSGSLVVLLYLKIGVLGECG